MSRKSLRPHLNQIRTWVRQGRTDAWIAHQLEVTVQQVQTFKREQELEADGAGGEATADAEVDLRAEDDAAIAAALEEEERTRREEEVKASEEAARQAAEAEARGETIGEEDSDDGDDAPRRGRARRGGRGRRRTGRGAGPLEATFEHGEEGYGLWLDAGVLDDPIYAEHWAGHRPVEVTIEEDQIVIRRAGSGESDD